MSVVQVSEDVQRMIDRHVAEGRAPDGDMFLDQAVRLYAGLLDADEDEVLAAADEGIADIEAGRYEVFQTAEDILGLRQRSGARLDALMEQARAVS